MAHSAETAAPTDEHNTGPQPSTLSKGLAAFAMPVLFILFLAATLVTAFHSPAPNDMALTIAGPSAITSQVVAGLEDKSADLFDITETDDVADVEASVERRDVVGAVVFDETGGAVTTYIASGGGRGAAGTVEAIGAQIASQMGAVSTVVEVAPLAEQDPLGSGVFYIIIYSTIGGFLALIVLTQLMPKARLRLMYGVAVASALLVPITVFGLSSIFLDGFGIGFNQLVGVLGVMALYILVVGLIVILSHQFLGKASTLAVVPITVFINFASAGGGSPVSMLPGFWQVVHSVWFGSAATEAVRDIVYFPGANPTRWILQLVIWVVALLALTLIVEGVKVIKSQKEIIAEAGRYKVETRDLLRARSASEPTQRAITSLSARTTTLSNEALPEDQQENLQTAPRTSGLPASS